MNSNIKNITEETLSDNWYVLKKYTFDYRDNNGEWQTQSREAYDRGNGATILLYNKSKKSVILTRQFRLPTYVNGNPDGMLIESCAGLLEKTMPKIVSVKKLKKRLDTSFLRCEKYLRLTCLQDQ